MDYVVANEAKAQGKAVDKMARAEGKATIRKEKEASFQGVSGEIADKGWEMQGEVLGENTYSGITLMLLQYYVEE